MLTVPPPPPKKATDLVLRNELTEKVDPGKKAGGLLEIKRILEDAIDRAKTRQGDAIVILVGGGSIIASDILSGVGQLIRPKYLEVANAVGAAVSRVGQKQTKTNHLHPPPLPPGPKIY